MNLHYSIWTLFFLAGLIKTDETLPKIDFDGLKNSRQDLVLVAVVNSKLGKEAWTELGNVKAAVDKSNEEENLDVKFYTSDDEKLVKEFSIIKFPQIIFYRHNRHVLFKGSDLKGLSEWLESHRDKITHDLNDGNFEHDTQAATGATTGDWFVLFHNSDCQTTKYVESAWEAASLRVRNRVNLAYVNIDVNPALKERFSIFNSPTIILFKQGKMYRYQISNFDVESLISFSTKFYTNVKAERVPVELTWFDKTTDTIVKYLKQKKISPNYVLAGAGVFILAGLGLVLTKCRSNKADKYKESKEYFKFD